MYNPATQPPKEKKEKKRKGTCISLTEIITENLLRWWWLGAVINNIILK